MEYFQFKTDNVWIGMGILYNLCLYVVILLLSSVRVSPAATARTTSPPHCVCVCVCVSLAVGAGEAEVHAGDRHSARLTVRRRRGRGGGGVGERPHRRILRAALHLG